MQLWGLKTVSWFDVWSIEHLVTGISVGGFSILINRWQRKKICMAQTPCSPAWQETILLLLAAYMWEALEHYLETGLAGAAVADWFQGVEFWGNRLITDPLLMLVGLALARRYTWLLWPARVFGLVWLGVHVFLFPNSMYLHEIF